MMATQPLSITLSQRVAAGNGLRIGRGSASPAAPVFAETDVSDAAMLTILWHRLSGSDPNDVGYDVSELIPADQVRMSTPLALTSSDLRDDLKAIFVNYTCAGAGNAEQDNMMSLQSFRACLKDAGILSTLPLRLDGHSNQAEISFSSPIRRRDAQYELASAQIDVIFTSCVRGYAARYGLLEATGSVHGMSFDVFVWALCKIALWRAPSSLTERLTPDDGTVLSLTLFHFMCMMHGAKRVDGVGNSADLLDDGVIQAFREGSACLERLFLYYGVLSSGSWVPSTARSPARSLGTTPHTDGATLPIKPNFLRFAQEFGICPGLLSRGKLMKLCGAVDPNMAPLLFPGFVELMARIAFVAYEQKQYVAEHPTPGSRVSALIRKLRLEPAYEACGVELRQRGLQNIMGEELWYAEAAIAGTRQLTTRMSVANQLTGRVDSFNLFSSSAVDGHDQGDEDDGLALLSASSLGPSTAAAPTSTQPLINVAAVMEHRSPRFLSAVRQALVPIPAGTRGSLQSATSTYTEEGAQSTVYAAEHEAEGSLVSPGEQAALMQYLASSRVVADYAALHGYTDGPSRGNMEGARAQASAAKGDGSFVGSSTMSSSLASPGLIVRSFPSAQAGLPSRITEVDEEGRSSAEFGDSSAAFPAASSTAAQPALMRFGSEAVLDVEQGAKIALEAAERATARPSLATEAGTLTLASASAAGMTQSAQPHTPTSHGQTGSSKRRATQTTAVLSKLGSSGDASSTVAERDFTLAEQVLTDILSSPNGHALVLPATVPAHSTQGAQKQITSPSVHAQGSGVRRLSGGVSVVAAQALPPSPPHEGDGGNTTGTGSTATTASLVRMDRGVDTERARTFLRASPRTSSTRSLLSHESAPSSVPAQASDAGAGNDHTAANQGGASDEHGQPLVASVRPTRSLKLVREANLSRIQAAEVSAGRTRSTGADGTVTDLPLQPLAGKPAFAKGFVSANSDKARSASATARQERKASIGGGSLSARVAGSEAGSPRVAGTSLSESSTAHDIVQVLSQGVPTPFPMPGMARIASARAFQENGHGRQVGENGRRAAALDTSLIADATAEMTGKKAPKPFTSPHGSRRAKSARSLPPAPQSLGTGHVVHPRVVDTLVSIFHPVVAPVLQPIFLYYCRLGGSSGNKGRLSHRNFVTLCKDLDLIDARVDTGAVELQLAVLQAKARGKQEEEEGGSKGEGHLSLEQFTEALLRMSELIRRAQQTPAEPGQAPHSPRDPGPGGGATASLPMLYADGGSSAIGTAEGADVHRAKVVAADFLARRVLPLLGLAREGDAVAASLATHATVQLLHEHSAFLKRIFAHYATYVGEPIESMDGEQKQGAANSSADSALHLSALQSQGEAGVGRPCTLQPPYMPAHAVLPAAWLRLCKDIEVVPGLASLHLAEAAMNESARRAGTFSTLDASHTGAQVESSLPGAPTGALSRSTAFDGRRSIPEESSGAAAIALAGKERISRGPLHRRGREVPGSARLEPVHLTLSQPTAATAGIPPMPTDAHKPLPSPADGTHLLYSAFVEALCRIAVSAFSASTLGSAYSSTASKVAALLAWVQSGRRLHLDVTWGKASSATGAAGSSFVGSSVGLQYAPTTHSPDQAEPGKGDTMPSISAAQLLQLVEAHAAEAAQGAHSTTGGSTLSHAASTLAQSLGLPPSLAGGPEEPPFRPRRSRSALGARASRARSTEGGGHAHGQQGSSTQGRAQAVSWLAQMGQGHMDGGEEESEAYMAVQAANVLTSVAGPDGMQSIAAGQADAATVTVQAALSGVRSPPRASGAAPSAGDRAEAEALRMVAATLASSGAKYGLDSATSSRMADAVRAAAPPAPAPAPVPLPGLTAADLMIGGVAFSPLGAYPKPYASRRMHRVIAVKQNGRARAGESDAAKDAHGEGAPQQVQHSSGAGIVVVRAASNASTSHSPLHDALAAGTLPAAPLFHKGEDKYYARVVAARGAAANKAVKTTLRVADAPLRMSYHVSAQLQGIQVQASAESISAVSVSVDGLVQAKTAQGGTLTAGPVPPAQDSAEGLAASGTGRGRSKGRRRAPAPPLPASPVRQSRPAEYGSSSSAGSALELFAADGSLDALATLLAGSQEGDHGQRSAEAAAGGVQGMTMSMLSPRAKLSAYHAAHRESLPESAFAPAAESLSVPLRGDVMQQFYSSLRSDTLTAGPSGTSSEFRVQRAGTGTVLRRIDLVHQTDTSVPAEAADEEVLDPKTAPQPRLWAASDVMGSPAARGRSGAVPPRAPVAPSVPGGKAFTQHTAPQAEMEAGRGGSTSGRSRGRSTVAVSTSGGGMTVPAASVVMGTHRSSSRTMKSGVATSSAGHNAVTLVRPATNMFAQKQHRAQEQQIADLTAGLGDDVAAMVRTALLAQPQPAQPHAAPPARHSPKAAERVQTHQELPTSPLSSAAAAAIAALDAAARRSHSRSPQQDGRSPQQRQSAGGAPVAPVPARYTSPSAAGRNAGSPSATGSGSSERRSMPMPAVAAALARASNQALLQSPTGVSSPLGSPASPGPALQRPRSTTSSSSSNTSNLLYTAGLSMATAAAAQARLDRIIGKAAATSPGPSPRQVKAPVHVSITSPVGHAALSGPVVAGLPPQPPGGPQQRPAKLAAKAPAQQPRYRRSTEDDADEYGGGGYEIE